MPDKLTDEQIEDIFEEFEPWLHTKQKSLVWMGPTSQFIWTYKFLEERGMHGATEPDSDRGADPGVHS